MIGGGGVFDWGGDPATDAKAELRQALAFPPVTAASLRRAYLEGKLAAVEGRGRERDPYVDRDRDLHQAWDDGWLSVEDCPRCEGEGGTWGVYGQHDTWESCPRCDGTGKNGE